MPKITYRSKSLDSFSVRPYCIYTTQASCSFVQNLAYFSSALFAQRAAYSLFSFAVSLCVILKQN